MDISRKTIPGAVPATDFTANIASRRYSLICYELETAPKGFFHIPFSAVSFLVLEGALQLKNPVIGLEKVAKPEEGFHVLEKSRFALAPVGGKVKFLVASAQPFTLANPEVTVGSHFEVKELSSYRVEKPWGWERWYTENLQAAPYALKMIYMTKDSRCSLQSHVFKSETNLILEGKALVLSGVEAPRDTTQRRIDTSKLIPKEYGPNEGWSNKVGELHRVIALESYKAVEISTPELDDVIRWQDDSGRTDGRIASEHQRKAA